MDREGGSGPGSARDLPCWIYCLAASEVISVIDSVFAETSLPLRLAATALLTSRAALGKARASLIDTADGMLSSCPI